MDLSAPALALGPGQLPAVDPHLVVLGVLVGAWLIDTVLAALEWLERARGDCADDPRGPGVGADGGPAGDPGGGPAGDPGGASRDASRLPGPE